MEHARHSDRILNPTTFLLLCAVAFVLPFDSVLLLPGLGTVTRFVGYVALASALVSVLLSGRFNMVRGPIVWLLAWGLWALLSYVWTVSPDGTVETLPTVLRVMGLAWLVYEFADSRERFRRILLAYVLGAFVAVGGVAWALMFGGMHHIGSGGFSRYALQTESQQMDPNSLALRLALGIPMAWHLQSMARAQWTRWGGRLYIPLAVVAVLLTGSRGGLLAVLAGLSITLPTLTTLRPKPILIALCLLALAGLAAYWTVPEDVLRRLQTLPSELMAGTLNLRTLLWGAGFDLLREQPALGLGVGAFATEVYAAGKFPQPMVAHSVPLGVLFELGPVGLFCLAGAVFSLWRGTWRLPREDGSLSRFALLTWGVGAAALSEDYTKVTWFILALIAAAVARAGAFTAEARRSEEAPEWPVAELAPPPGP